MELLSLKFIGVGLMSLGMFGAAMGVSNIFCALFNSMSRNPSLAEQLQRVALIGAGLVEAMGLFAFVIAIIIIFV